MHKLFPKLHDDRARTSFDMNRVNRANGNWFVVQDARKFWVGGSLASCVRHPFASSLYSRHFDETNDYFLYEELNEWKERRQNGKHRQTDKIIDDGTIWNDEVSSRTRFGWETFLYVAHSNFWFVCRCFRSPDYRLHGIVVAPSTVIGRLCFHMTLR